MASSVQYSPYGGSFYNSGTPPQKTFKFTYTFEPPSSLSIEVTHQQQNPVIYVRKLNHFMSLSMDEMYDIAHNSKHILKKLELCRQVLRGTSDYYPRNKKDMTMVAKRSERAKELDEENEMAMFYNLPPPPSPPKRHKKKKSAQKLKMKVKRGTSKKTENNGGGDAETGNEDEEEEEGGDDEYYEEEEEEEEE